MPRPAASYRVDCTVASGPVRTNAFPARVCVLAMPRAKRAPKAKARPRVALISPAEPPGIPRPLPSGRNELRSVPGGYHATLEGHVLPGYAGGTMPAHLHLPGHWTEELNVFWRTRRHFCLHALACDWLRRIRSPPRYTGFPDAVQPIRNQMKEVLMDLGLKRHPHDLQAAAAFMQSQILAIRTRHMHEANTQELIWCKLVSEFIGPRQ